MDTEPLVEKLDYRIFDFAERWKEGRDSPVKTLSTAIRDFQAILRLRHRVACLPRPYSRASSSVSIGTAP